jgi:alpha-aminoadipic semialdehyde synthase
LTAALNPAQYKLDGEISSIPGDQLLAEHFLSVPLWKGLALEGLANRDSLPYAEKYGMGEISDLTNLFRGTLRYVRIEEVGQGSIADNRYRGFSSLLDSFRRLGLLSSEPIQGDIKTWEDFLARSTEKALGFSKPLKNGDMSSVLRDILPQRSGQGDTEEALRWSVLDTDGRPYS